MEQNIAGPNREKTAADDETATAAAAAAAACRADEQKHETITAAAASLPVAGELPGDNTGDEGTIPEGHMDPVYETKARVLNHAVRGRFCLFACVDALVYSSFLLCLACFPFHPMSWENTKDGGHRDRVCVC